MLINSSEHWMKEYYYLHLKKKKILPWEKLLCMETKYCNLTGLYLGEILDYMK